MAPRKLAYGRGKSIENKGEGIGKGKNPNFEIPRRKSPENQSQSTSQAKGRGPMQSPINLTSPAKLISNLIGGMVIKICIHHSGSFTKKPNRQYVGGYDITYPLFGIQKLTFSVLSGMVKKFNVGNENLPIYYKIPGMDLDLGLKVLSDEQNIQEIVENIDLLGCDEVDLYLDENDSFKHSNISASLVIEDEPNLNDVDHLLPDNDAFLADFNASLPDCNANVNDLNSNFNEEVEQMCQSVEASLGNHDSETEGSNSEIDSNSDSDFIDSEYGMDSDDDDALYDACVDKTVEWGGVSRTGIVAGGSDSNCVLDDDDVNDDEACGIDDEIHSLHSSDDDNPRLPEFNSNADMNNVEFSVGMLFASKEVLKQAVLEYGLQNGKAVQCYKNDRVRIRAWCNKGTCPWMLYATNVKGQEAFQIRTYQSEHNCGRIFKNKVVTASWLAKKYLNEFRADPEWSIKSFRARLQSDYIVGCSRSQLYRARNMVINMISGSEMEQYSKVYDYCEELRKTNPGTTAIVQTEASLIENGRPTFKRIYICLGASKKGFKSGCRKVIGVDGCHLKGNATGQILAAVGIDANNQSFPVAYAVVEAENRDSWEWFIQILKDDLDITRENEKEFTFINDKQKGLIPALEALVGGAEHRHCAWHLYTNFKEHHKGKQLKEKMDQASKATTVPTFHKAMSQLRALDEEAYKWLATKDELRYWSRSHFRTLSKCDMLTNNPCESFNSFIKEARDKPIISLCETIRNLLMKRMSIRKQKMMKYGKRLCPNIDSKLEKLKAESCSWSPLWSGGLLYQVSCSDYEQYAVDLANKSCSCRKWDLNGIPCCHAISAIYHHNFVPEDYVHDCYLTLTNLKIYDQVIYPMNGQSMWEETPYNRPLPPPYKKQPGRPKKLRRRGITEQALPKTGKMPRGGMTMRCSICGIVGHNLRGCAKRQKTDSANASQATQEGQSQTNQRKGTKSNSRRVPIEMSQASIGDTSSNTPIQVSQTHLRRSPRKQSMITSQAPVQMSQTNSAPNIYAVHREKLQTRRNSKASATVSACGTANATATASASASAFGTASATASLVSGVAKAKASSSNLTKKQAAKYQSLVEQGKFREI